MFQILLIVFVSILLGLATIYLIYSRYLKKHQISRYWNYREIKPDTLNSIRNEFQDQDQVVNIYKEAIQKTIRLRNQLQRTLNELNILVKDFESNSHPFDIQDNKVLVELYENIIQLNNEFKLNLDQNKNTSSDGPNNLINEIYSENSSILNTLGNFLTLVSKDKKPISKLINTTNEITDKHERVIVLHKELIAQYQDTLSKI